MKKTVLFPVFLMLIICFCTAPAAADPVPQVVRPVGIFNCGINCGWLHATIGNGIFKHEWDNYSRNARAELINAFSPPLRGLGWNGDPADILNAISGIKGILQQYLGKPWLALYNGGVGLGVAHILAQVGKCPTCLKNTLWSAGNDLEMAAKMMGNQKLLGIALAMKQAGSAMPAHNMNMQQTQAYTGLLAKYIVNIQTAF